MKSIKIFITFLLVIGAVACRDESKYPIDFDKINNTNGAFLRQISVPSSSFDLYNLGGSEFTVVLEAYDANNGKDLESVDFYVSFVDNSEDNGTLEPDDEVFVKNVGAASFTKDPESGLPRTTVTITAQDAADLLQIDFADIDGGDQFVFKQVMKLKDGREYSADNTSADIVGGAFYNSPFSNTVPVVCPSDLVGKYDAVTDWIDYYGDPGTETYEVDLTLAKDDDENPIPGNYILPDLSGGMEPIIWSNPPVEVVMEDVCGVIYLKSYEYGYAYFILEGSYIDTDTGVITIVWKNEYDEHGTTVLTPQ